MISGKDVTRAGVVAAALVLLAAGAVQAVDIETVPVGNSGNAADTTGYGAVDHNYRIGKYEVTVDQYTEFLNYHHHHSHLSFSPPQYFWDANHIVRSGSGTTDDPYIYTVALEYANNPMAYVSFWDACRFVNWLNNGQGDGDTETGAYTLNGYNDSAGGDISRNPGARWVIPTIDEWYKAAYYYTNDISHILSGGSEGGYFAEPTASAYGTVDQYGNGWEWSESVGVGDSCAGRILGGGPVGINVDFKGSSLGDPSRSSGPSLPWEDYEIPAEGGGGFGFRVAEVPEPATLALLAVGGLVALRRRR